MYAATTPTASAGTTIDAVLEDLDVLLAAIPSGAQARFYFAVDSTNAKRLAVKSGNGVPAFPKFGINGGEIIPGVMGLVSDSLPAGAALLFDASQIMADSGKVSLDVAHHASVQFDTSPDSPPSASTVPANLWQNDLVALKAERDYAYSVMRTTAVASLSGVDYSN